MRSIFKLILMNQIGSVGALGGDPPPDPAPGGDPDPNPGDGGNGPSPEEALYGNIKVSWPEGIEDSLKGEASLKSFVDPEGNINVANLAKSFVNTKKQMGSDKAVLPNENSSDEEVNAFWDKLGFQSDKEQYSINKVDDSKLDEKFMGDLKEFAYEHKVPVETANKLASFLHNQVVEGEKEAKETQTTSINTGLDEIKTEYGQAYDQKLGVAKRVLSEVVKDESVIKAFEDPMIGSNPNIIRALVKIGESLYKEDNFNGGAGKEVFSPDEAQEKINMIMGNKDHPYNKPNHPGHNDAVKKVMKLFEMKQ